MANRLIVKLLPVFTLILIFLFPGLTNAATFTDVLEDHENYNAVQYLFDEGIVEGYDDGSFKPDNTINRAEFTKIVLGAVETVDITDNSLGSIELTDLEDGAWYIPYIKGAIARGMIAGYPDKTFKPSNEINFAEVAKIVAIAFDFPQTDDSIWYKPYVDNLASNNAIPISIVTFNQNITRGEMAEIIFRILTEATDETSQDYETLEANVGSSTAQEIAWRNFAFDHINQLREENGVGPLIMNNQLNEIAMHHSMDMAHYIGEMSHEGSLGEQSNNRIKEGKVPDIDTHAFIFIPFPDNIGWSGENVGMRNSNTFGGDVEKAIISQHEWFMDEPSDVHNHRTTMLSILAPFSEVGIGIYVKDSVVWITEDYISTL